MTDAETLPETLVADMAARARTAAVALAAMDSLAKGRALAAAAQAIRASESAILEANALDMAAGEARGLSGALLDRLKLDPKRVEAMAAGVEAVGKLADPVGKVIERVERPNGLVLTRVRVPIGVIGIIYESRPNVTADAGALCAIAIHAALAEGLAAGGMPADAVQLIPTTDRAAVGAMLTAEGAIDMVVPRGGKSLVARVQAEARVPVLAHLDGLCHTYIDRAADPEMARSLALNAKMRRTGICGATETLLIDRGFADPVPVLGALADAGCELRGDAEIRSLEPRTIAANAEDWDTEYLDSILSVKLVDGVGDAMAHIAAHGSHHTDAIVTEDEATAERFLNGVDSAIVMWNASTQFADGGEFGLGAEIGISTGRLHARGPVALEGLTTYKWVVRGTGQARP